MQCAYIFCKFTSHFIILFMFNRSEKVKQLESIHYILELRVKYDVQTHNCCRSKPLRVQQTPCRSDSTFTPTTWWIGMVDDVTASSTTNSDSVPIVSFYEKPMLTGIKKISTSLSLSVANSSSISLLARSSRELLQSVKLFCFQLPLQSSKLKMLIIA